jgi:hypothetical protein
MVMLYVIGNQLQYFMHLHRLLGFHFSITSVNDPVPKYCNLLYCCKTRFNELT